jgi:hypothetical protein
MAEIQRHLIRRNSPPTPTLKSLHTNWFAESHLTWSTAPRSSFPLCIGGHCPSYTRNRIPSARRAAFPDFLGHDPSCQDFFFLFTDRDRHVFWTFCGMSRGLCTSPKADYTTQSIYGSCPAIITASCRSRCHAPTPPSVVCIPRYVR